MKKTLVLGASVKEQRYSNIAIHRLLSHKVPTVAIGLREGKVGGIPIEIGKPHLENVDTVTLYLSPKNQIEYYDYIVGLKPKRVIFNPGTENPELYHYLDKYDIKVITACTLVMLATNQY